MKKKNWNAIGMLLVCGMSVWSCKDDADPSGTEQLVKDIETIDTYLDEQGITANEDISGLRFRINTLGSGLPPRIENQVKINYTEKFLPTGEILNQGTITDKVSSFMPGLNIGLILLPVGTKATLYIPSTYYYPDKTPAKNLIFDVELVEIVKSVTETQRFTSDTTAINTYLAQEAIAATKDDSGVRFVVLNPGAGIAPTLYTQVKISYTGKVLGTDDTFITGTSEPTHDFMSRVVDYLLGLQVGIQKLKEGGKIRLFVPSGLGFGIQAQNNLGVPANSILEFEVELLDKMD